MGAYADSRGTKEYNMWLIKRRLEKVKSYLYSKNVNKFQISGKAYGELKIVNKCMNNTICSESDHKMNRRVHYNFVRETINNSKKIKN